MVKVTRKIRYTTCSGRRGGERGGEGWREERVGEGDEYGRR
jgi:hypothetical protein